MSTTRTLVALAGAAVATALVVLPIIAEPARLIYVLAFCLLVPGGGWALRWGSGDAGDRLALAVLISLSATIIVATAMVATETWSVAGGVGVLAVIGALGFIPIGRDPRLPRLRVSGR
ncbi:hypothetical protein [Dietzia lutea]|uniref:DUF1616 domain-containing protein n=1 Tax=Dietzia lutea TaxID=546160 RepID=A0A2S1R3P1_9ACTN|nr:hypothetical protein [Dietzia lutea]AWH90875.1 hypothetical protein A6035_00275 [Dietzia lutea]